MLNDHQKIVIITQARMGSTRLPQKIMKKVLDKTLLEFHLERLKRAESAHQVVVATTTNPEDAVIVELCQKLKVPTFRGSENDVLDRYFKTAEYFGADIIVRVTSDCPLIDSSVIDDLITIFLEPGKNYDCIANCNDRNRSYPIGMDCEIFSFKALDKAHHEAKNSLEREHVTPYLWGHPELFRLAVFHYPKNYSYLRWTLDTPEDFEVIRRILEAIYPIKPNFGLEDLLALAQTHPEWQRINSRVKHNYYSEMKR